eukprot:g2390.t1
MFSPKVNAGEEGVFWMYYSGCSSEPSIKTEGRELVIRSGLAMSQVHKNQVVVLSLWCFKNGYHWARIEGSDSSGAVLDVGEEKDWDCAFIGRPQVLNCGNRDLRMYYHSYDIDEECYKIGLAKSGNGLNWEKSGVIFKGSEMYQFDSKGAASQCVVYDQDNAQFLMFYEAVNDSNGRSIGLAVSKDGLENWKVYKEPVLSPSVSGRWDSGAVGTPWAVSMEEGKWRIYYSGTKQTAPYWEGIGVATSDQSGTKFHKIPEWETFVEKAFELYEKDPLRCRYTTKSKSSSGKLALKITDDKQCFTHNLRKNELWKLEKFNAKFLQWMATGKEPLSTSHFLTLFTVELDDDVKTSDGGTSAKSRDKQGRRSKRKE